MAGAIYMHEGRIGATRIIRDDVLDSLYGKQSAGAKRIIEHGLAVFCEAAGAANSLEKLSAPIMGLIPGDLRITAARSLPELLRTIAILHSSLANLDKLEELEESDAPMQEEVNRRFSTEVRDLIVRERPDLMQYFGREAKLVDGGQNVRFGFCSPRVVAHFNVLHPIRVSASLRDARARLFELQRVQAMISLPKAALIGAVTRDDDATLSAKQINNLLEARREITEEALAAGVEYFPVTNASDGAQRVLKLAA
ncbi:hypothetical protein GCM10011408_23360 [Dyella caseinilytica]|nr:hypothetical protein GCM10011408_23360 [Dyella caseinilytica]